jgi:hypothetical protein
MFLMGFGIISGTISLLSAVEQTPQSLSLFKMDRKVFTVIYSVLGKEIPSEIFHRVILTQINTTICNGELGLNPERINTQLCCRQNSLCKVVLEL